MSTVAEFFRNPLVTWVNTFKSTSPAETISEFADGVFLNEIMVEIDPTYFTLTRVHQNVDGDTNIRIQNLDILVRHLKAFYQEKLQQVVLLRAPDVVAIAHHPDNDVGLQELIKILLLMLGCAVQCDSKEHFIEKITELDLEVQKHLVDCIKQITENPSHVLTFRPSDLQDTSLEHVLDVTENMFYQMCQVVEERDQNYGVITHLSIEKDVLLQEKQRSKSPRPFSPPPSVAAQLSVESPSIIASKEKIRILTEDLEEKNSLFSELKEELLVTKRTVEKLRQENKMLSKDAILVKTYRDQTDMLKSKADRVEKLEADATKFKEKLRDLEYLKKRAEELKEENQLLYDNKVLLEGQLSGMSNKEERIEILEEENKKLKTHIHHLAEERQYDQEKMKEVMASNAQLTLEKQESMAELFSLNAEIEVLRGKSPSGSVNLASECNESSSMDVLRLSHQNQHLKKSLEDLRGASAKLIDLERESRTVHDKYLEEKSTNHRLSQELAKFKAENKQKGTEVEKLARSVRALEDELHMSSGELKQRREVIAHLEQENYSQASELEDKTKSVQDQEGNVATLEERAALNDKQLFKLANKNNEREVVISDMKKRMQEKQSTIDELSDSLAGKERQLKSLQSRLDETVEEQQKGDEFIRKQKKEIAELENRLPDVQGDVSADSSAAASAISSPRIPTKAERDFRELKKEKSKYYKHECHQRNLKLYRERGMIPEGLKLNATPYVSDVTESFVTRWEVILKSASEMLLDLLISHHEEALRMTWNNITRMETCIQDKYGEELATRILQLGNEIARKDKEKLQEKAQIKLVKRSTDKKPQKNDSFNELKPNRESNTGGRVERYGRDDAPREEFRDRQQFGGSGRRSRGSRNNPVRSYVGAGRGRKQTTM